LDTNGLHATKSALIDEAQLSHEYQICDNIDLDQVYLEFLSYYRLKFGKIPKIARRLDVIDATASSVRTSPTAENHTKKQLLKKQRSATQAEPCKKDCLLGVSGSSLPVVKEVVREAQQHNDCVYSHSERIRDCASSLYPSEFSYKGEWKELANLVYR
jgi:hypothetical protein